MAAAAAAAAGARLRQVVELPGGGFEFSLGSMAGRRRCCYTSYCVFHTAFHTVYFTLWCTPMLRFRSINPGISAMNPKPQAQPSTVHL